MKAAISGGSGANATDLKKNKGSVCGPKRDGSIITGSASSGGKTTRPETTRLVSTGICGGPSSMATEVQGTTTPLKMLWEGFSSTSPTVKGIHLTGGRSPGSHSAKYAGNCKYCISGEIFLEHSWQLIFQMININQC